MCLAGLLLIKDKITFFFPNVGVLPYSDVLQKCFHTPLPMFQLFASSPSSHHKTQKLCFKLCFFPLIITQCCHCFPLSDRRLSKLYFLHAAAINQNQQKGGGCFKTVASLACCSHLTRNQYESEWGNTALLTASCWAPLQVIHLCSIKQYIFSSVSAPHSI